ncbi:LytR C-terminal domain-containing protein [Jiangella rhizosphaerae]|uniref:LytR family transcriptional regulator n=1 Tax=Jiangella rhizosphaerae TaxID=2293569 RepID=A0A418KN12_9ACTN|nr:LytR C-terminal domain-containing protein [Jiangella rhizosphaerae]RIQ20345.1 LytR family transcriptional regulator [Jiangella rhizosphaerae]
MAFEDEELTVEEAARRHRWRRIRTSVTLLVLIGVVIGAAWYSWSNVVDDGETTASGPTGEPCAPGVPTAAPAPADVQVNVYNSTDRNGLASTVAREVRARGFVVVDVDNDPLERSITGTAEVRSRPDDQAAAELVATLVPGAVYVPDERTEATIDLVLGDAFQALADPAAPPATPAAGLPPCQAAP